MSLLETIKPFVDGGFAIHWLHPRDKRPIGDNWQERPVASFDSLKRRFQADNNVGVRLGEFSRVAGGYLHVLDLDIRKPEQAAAAWKTLRCLLPDVRFDALPSVISGSGGESRHIYFVTDRPFRSKKLARSEGWSMVFDPKKGREVRKHDWEIELFGAPKQVAMPPSIHPDTGKPYRWERPFDFDAIEFGDVPEIPADALDAAGAATDPDDDFEANDNRLELTEDEARDILALLPLDYWCEDRDGWREVGMALKHEFGDAGYDLWEEFSKQSTKFDGKDQRAVWKSFKGKTKRPIRMATLKAAANDVKRASLADEFDDLEDDDIDAGHDDFDDIAAESSANDNDWDGGPDDDDGVLPWKSLIDYTEDGGYRPTLHNLRLIVENDIRTRGVPAFNEFKQEVVQYGKPGIKDPKRKGQAKPFCQLKGPSWNLYDPINGDFWTEDKDNAIRAVIEAPKTQGGYGFKVPDRDLRAAIDIVGRLNGFHPVRSYLSELTWDGKPRVERLFIDYLGAPDDAYTRSVARVMMTAGVARVMEPGCKFDFAVILQGLQGKRKSTFIQVLAKNWFAELEGDFEDARAMVEAMQGAWILEMPELGGFVRADVRHIKAFVSRRSDKVRLAYAKRAQEYHRQCIFIGSTNDDKFLKDDTGNRRFWPIRCTVDSIDTDLLGEEVDQLWAEALVLYKQMRKAKPHGMLPLYLTDEDAQGIAARLQESARVESADDALAGEIAAWLEKPIISGDLDDDFSADGQPVYRNETCLLEIWVECLRKDRGHYNQQVAQMLGRAMSKIEGWAADGRLTNFPQYGRQRAYDRGGYRGHISRT